MNTIEKFLNKFGYIKIEIETESDFAQSEEEKLFSDLSGVDGFNEYLSSILSKDMKRYFIADKVQQDIIKGGYSRVVYLKSRLNKTT